MSTVVVDNECPNEVTVTGDSPTVVVESQSTTVEVNTQTTNVNPANLPHDNLSGVTTSQWHKKISNSTITYNLDGTVDRVDWANGDYEEFNYDIDGNITTIVGNGYTKTFVYTLGIVTGVTWSLTP
jgi:hypothetical protein